MKLLQRLFGQEMDSDVKCTSIELVEATVLLAAGYLIEHLFGLNSGPAQLKSINGIPEIVLGEGALRGGAPGLPEEILHCKGTNKARLLQILNLTIINVRQLVRFNQECLVLYRSSSILTEVLEALEGRPALLPCTVHGVSLAHLMDALCA